MRSRVVGHSGKVNDWEGGGFRVAVDEEVDVRGVYCASAFEARLRVWKRKKCGRM